MKHNTCSLAVIMLATIAPTVEAAPAAHGPMTMEVAGVRLGMTLESARRAAAEASYTCKPFGKELTFDEQVDKEAKQRAGRSDPFRVGTGTMQLECKGTGGEDLRIEFAQLRTGPIVDEYRLQIDGRTIDLTALRRQLTAKYGRPTVGNELLGSWCDVGYRCGAGVVFSEGPTVLIDATSRVDIMATRGDRARKTDLQEVTAAADAVAPKKSSAAF